MLGSGPKKALPARLSGSELLTDQSRAVKLALGVVWVVPQADVSPSKSSSSSVSWTVSAPQAGSAGGV